MNCFGLWGIGIWDCRGGYGCEWSDFGFGGLYGYRPQKKMPKLAEGKPSKKNNRKGKNTETSKKNQYHAYNNIPAQLFHTWNREYVPMGTICVAKHTCKQTQKTIMSQAS